MGTLQVTIEKETGRLTKVDVQAAERGPRIEAW